MLFGERDSILRNDSLASRCMRRNKDGVTQFEMVDCLLLESIEFKRILMAHHRVSEK
jgi:hypothetical protein